MQESGVPLLGPHPTWGSEHAGAEAGGGEGWAEWFSHTSSFPDEASRTHCDLSKAPR